MSNSTRRPISGPTGPQGSRGFQGDSGGWIDDGSVVRLTTASDQVGIGTDTVPNDFKVGIQGHVGPQVDDTYDLGNPSFRWRNVYVGPQSLYVGDVKISDNNGRLTVLDGDGESATIGAQGTVYAKNTQLDTSAYNGIFGTQTQTNLQLAMDTVDGHWHEGIYDSTGSSPLLINVSDSSLLAHGPIRPSTTDAIELGSSTLRWQTLWGVASDIKMVNDTEATGSASNVQHYIAHETAGTNYYKAGALLAYYAPSQNNAGYVAGGHSALYVDDISGIGPSTLGGTLTNGYGHWIQYGHMSGATGSFTTTTLYGLRMNCYRYSGSFDTIYGIHLGSIGSASASAVYPIYEDMGSSSFTSYFTGKISAYDLTDRSASERRFKENIASMTNSLSTLLQLEPVIYNYIASEADRIYPGLDPTERDKTRVGFISDDVQNIYPYGVTYVDYEIPDSTVAPTEGNPRPTVTESIMQIEEKAMIPLLVGAVKELSAKVDALEAQLGP